MKEKIMQFRMQFVVSRNHSIYAMLLTAIIVCAHLIFQSAMVYLPLVLIYNLLIFRTSKKRTTKQLYLLWQTLLPALPFVLIIAMYLTPYIWTLPLMLVVYMIVIHMLRLPAQYTFGGILINVAYFSTYTWDFYIIQTFDILFFSLVAYMLARFFYLQPLEQFKLRYKETNLLFQKLLIEVIEGQYSHVSEFFINYHKMQQLFETIYEEQLVSTNELLRYEQLLWEMEEAYFYMRSLIDAPIILNEKLYNAYQHANIELNKERLLLGESPYNFHAKNLLRHFKQWRNLETMLKKEGLL